MNYNLTRLNWVFKYVPFVAALYRFWIYVTVRSTLSMHCCISSYRLLSFPQSDIRYLVWTKHGRWARKNFAEKVATKYIKATAPAHLHDKLIPKYGQSESSHSAQSYCSAYLTTLAFTEFGCKR